MSDTSTSNTAEKTEKDATAKTAAKVYEKPEQTVLKVRINTEAGHVGGVVPGKAQFRVQEGVVYNADVFEPQILSSFLQDGVLVIA